MSSDARNDIFKKDEKNNLTKELLDVETIIDNLWNYWDANLNGLYSTTLQNWIYTKNNKDLIESNERLSRSNEENQKTMNDLTKLIVIASAFQAIAAVIWLIITFCK
jgi:hypothetical protein